MSLHANSVGDVLPLLDSRALVKDPADPTKRVRIDAGNVTTATTAVITVGMDIDLRTGGTSTFQPRDATLTAFAGLTFADEAILVATGADAFETVVMAAHVGTLIRSADAAAARTAIGAVGQAEVDAAVRGLDWKASVRAATTADITLSGAQTIDGVSVIAGEAVLVKNQATGSQNGIYLCAAGAWTRRTDCDVDAEVTAGLAVCVSEGTTQGNTTWVLTTDDPITVASTALTFTQLGAGAADDSITNAKLANMAEATIKGRAAGAGTGDPTDLTASQARTAIGVVIGTDVQAFDAQLSSVAALAYAGNANKIIRVNGAENAFELAATGSGDVVGPASATDNAIVRYDGTTGKLIQDSSNTIDDAGRITHKATVSTTNVAADGATVTFDLALGNFHQVTLGGNRTLALSNETTGQNFMVDLIQDGTGSRTVTWWSGITWLDGDGSVPVLPTAAGTIYSFGFRITGSGAYRGYLLGANGF